MRLFRLVQLGLVLATGVLAGCASFHTIPLPDSADTKTLNQVRVSRQQLTGGSASSMPFEISDGLNRMETAILAVLNNPDLVAARLQAGVAQAQVLQAGLLPNPQLSVDFMHPTGGPPPLYNGYSLGLSEDITAIIARGASKASATAHARDVNLSIVWQEWQTAEQARQLFTQSRFEQRMLAVLHDQRRFYRVRYEHEKRALDAGNATRTDIAPLLVQLADTNSRSGALTQQHSDTRHALNALLGIQPESSLRLAESDPLALIDAATFDAALARIVQRRPDLLALQAGYESQQQQVREAILKQFPQLSIGPTRASDTSRVGTIGLGFVVSLPLFDRNQAQIAQQRATRALLRQQYQARLDQAYSQAHVVFDKIAILSDRLAELKSYLPELRQTSTAARRSFEAGNLSPGSYITLRSNTLDQRIAVLQLSSDLEQSQIALETLLGLAAGASSLEDAT